MKNFIVRLSLAVLIINVTACVSSQKTNADSNEVKGLKEYYKSYFPIGVAVSPRALKTDEAGLILQHFNSMTPENAMKMGPIHPNENEYFWKDADSIAAFAKRNNLKLRGHTLYPLPLYFP